MNAQLKAVRDKNKKCLRARFIVQTQLFSFNLADNRSKNPISYEQTTSFKIAKKFLKNSVASVLALVNLSPAA